MTTLTICIDERETTLHEKMIGLIGVGSPTKSIEKRVLSLGDVLLKRGETELLIIERKSIQDLLASIKDGRYEEQSYRLVHSGGLPLHHILYIIEGVFQGQTTKEKQMVYSAIVSLQFFKGCSVWRTHSIHETADVILQMTDKIERDFKKGKSFHHNLLLPQNKVEPTVNDGIKDDRIEDGTELENEIVSVCLPSSPTIPAYCSVVKKVKKENITPANIGEIILSQIPAVSAVSAVAIMREFDGKLSLLIESFTKEPTRLEKVRVGEGEKTRKISKAVVQNIRLYLGV